MKITTASILGGPLLLFTSSVIIIGRALADQELESVYSYCKKNGYKIQDERAKTEDGYILTLHRLSCVRNTTTCSKKRPPVLVMHGLTGSSADYLALGPERALGFKLADQGYDVYLGNQRGNKYSRRHATLDPDLNKEFWDFSFHEIGTYDVPAMIDHIIKRTNFTKVNYIGMSQGSVVLFVMASTRPEYNDKIQLASVMAPVTTLHNTKSLVFKLLADFYFVIDPVIKMMGLTEVFTTNCFYVQPLKDLCLGSNAVAKWFCFEYLVKHVIGASDQLDISALPFHWSVSPAGASVKQVQHFVQNRISGRFEQYDYYEENELIYNQRRPPPYNLSELTAPLAVYYSKADVFSNIDRLYKEMKEVPNLVLKYKVPYNKFNHLDFVYAKDINVLVHNKLIQLLNQFNNKTN